MNNRRWIVALALTALAGSLALGTVVARPPPPLPDHDYDIQYYADPGQTQRIGGERWTCSGEHLSWGQRSSYRFYSQMPCNPAE